MTGVGRMRARAWIVYLAVLLGGAAGYVFTVDDSWVQIGWQVAIGWVAARSPPASACSPGFS
jgi:hypothetical protein